MDIRRPLMNGDKILFLEGEDCFIWNSSKILVPCDVESCDLCKMNTHLACKGCPLIENGMGCANRNSPYNAFYNNPNLKTATDMVHALVRTYWSERNGENN